jgi:hypothetical protein
MVFSPLTIDYKAALFVLSNGFEQGFVQYFEHFAGFGEQSFLSLFIPVVIAF